MPEAKHRWGGWSHDGEQFAFATNRRDESVFDVYVQDRDAIAEAAGDDDDTDEDVDTDESTDAELLFEGDGWLSVGGWSPDDDKLLVTEAYSNFDQDVYVLDVASGELDHLTPHEGDVRYRSAEWAPSGDGLYLVTDEDSDTLDLAHLGLDGSLETVAAGAGWNVDGVSVDQESGHIAYSRNVEGYNELTVGEIVGPATIDEYPDPDLPGGIAGGVSWGPAGERFAVSVTGRTVNTNVFVGETATGEATPSVSSPWAARTADSWCWRR